MELIWPRITIQNAEGEFVLARYERHFDDGEVIDFTLKISREKLIEAKATQIDRVVLDAIDTRIGMLTHRLGK